MTPYTHGTPFCTMLNFSVGCNFCYILLDKHHLNQKQFHCKKKWVSYHLISWYLNSYLFRSCKKFNVPIWNQNMNINTCRKNSNLINTCTNFRQVLYFRSTYMQIKITIWILMYKKTLYACWQKVNFSLFHSFWYTCINALTYVGKSKIFPSPS